MILNWKKKGFYTGAASVIAAASAMVWATAGGAIPGPAKVTQVVVEFTNQLPSNARVTQILMEVMIRPGSGPTPTGVAGCVTDLPLGTSTAATGCDDDLTNGTSTASAGCVPQL